MMRVNVRFLSNGARINIHDGGQNRDSNIGDVCCAGAGRGSVVGGGAASGKYLVLGFRGPLPLDPGQRADFRAFENMLSELGLRSYVPEPGTVQPRDKYYVTGLPVDCEVDIL